MKGILFKPDMIQAIVEGRKTQTRRVIKPQPVEMTNLHEGEEDVMLVWRNVNLTPDALCKYAPYQVGEVIYVKEAFMFKAGADCREAYVGSPEEYLLGKPPFYLYRLDDTQEIRDYGKYYKWRSPMMMPEKAARYFLKITGVRVERLQEITPHDCILEGIIEEYGDGLALRDKFESVWNSINPKYPWEMNLWVWVYSFERVDG